MTDKDSPQADQPELTAVNQGNATQAAGESKTEPPVDTMPSLEQLLKQAELQAEEHLEAALAVENATVENFKSGMELTRKQLTAAFEKFNIKVIDPQGEKFDPHLHQAISTVDSDLAPNTVVQVMQKGYVLNDRVIRPALVIVSRARGA